jgi:hypothetical protein
MAKAHSAKRSAKKLDDGEETVDVPDELAREVERRLRQRDDGRTKSVPRLKVAVQRRRARA